LVKYLERVEKERIKKRNERLKEKEKRQKRTEEENKKAKATSFEKLKRDLLEEARREPQRNSSIFNFNEPTPGCRYDIGENHGYVLIPIDNLAEVIGPHAIGDTLYGDLIHEYTYSIAEQLFDNLGGKLDIQVITVEQYQFFANEIEMAFGHAPEYVTTHYIHNTKFFTITARNDIFSTCDQIRDSLKKNNGICINNIQIGPLKESLS